MKCTRKLSNIRKEHDPRRRPGFETPKETVKRRQRNEQLLWRGKRKAYKVLARKLRRCKKGRRCGSWACDVCKRRARVWLVGAASEAVGNKPILAVTLVLK